MNSNKSPEANLLKYNFFCIGPFYLYVDPFIKEYENSCNIFARNGSRTRYIVAELSDADSKHLRQLALLAIFQLL